MKSTFIKNLLELNLSTLLISSAAVFARHIPLPPSILIFWRGAIAFICIGLLLLAKKQSFKISNKKDQLRLVFSSILFALHWVTYFYSLQISSVAIGILSLYTFPVITTFLEPIYFKTKFNKQHFLLALLVILGLYIMSPNIDFSSSNTQGVFIGVISAFFFALRNIMMKTNSNKYNSSTLMFYQFGLVALLLLPFLFTETFNFSFEYLPAIICLGIITTAFGHTLFIKSLKNFEVSSASLIASTQPIYGILLGVLFLSEIPDTKTIIGGAIIISTVFIESYFVKKKNQ